MMKGQLLNDRYQIKDTIGGGGMADVYLAEDLILQRDVAVKVLRFEYANDEEFIARFDREAQSATSLSHPNIVNIYDVGEEDHILYMVMEYVDGMTLKAYVQHYGPLNVDKALDIMKQLTSAIANAHSNNIVHRDIKPQNVLINSNGQVKVTDFGIAMALSATALTQTNAVLGSVHYLSPEQARGGAATKKSDIYSLGIVLFELLTGRMPFSGQTSVAVALKHLQSDPPSVRRFNALVPQSVENIVLQATAKDPFHRYQTVNEMSEALDHALDPSNQDVAPFTPPEEDGEATKAIPVIGDQHYQNNQNGDTIVHSNQSHSDQSSPSGKDNKTKKPKKGKWLWLGALLLALIGAGIAAIFIVPGLFQPDDVDVPDVVGMTADEALDKLEDHQLQGDENQTYSEEVEEGHVIKTDPKSGQSVKENDEIALYISQGKEPVTFDDYTGQSISQVERILNNKGYDNIMTIQKNSEQPEGQIIKQIQPEPDEKVIPEDTRVIFNISIGPESVTMINLKNMTEKEVNRYIDDQNLELNKQMTHSDSVPEGEVIRHTPGPSEEVNEGETIDVYFSKGPEEKPVSTVYESFKVSYSADQDNPDNDESKPEQQVTIYIDDMNRDISHVARQEPITEDTRFEIELAIAPDEEASYKVMRDDEVIKEKTIPYDKEGE